jgi:hypothetical protein
MVVGPACDDRAVEVVVGTDILEVVEDTIAWVVPFRRLLSIQEALEEDANASCDG